MRKLAWIPCFLVALSCRTADSAAPDLAAAIRVAINHVDPEHRAVIVADDELTKLVDEAVGHDQRVVTSHFIPETERERLPAGWLIVQAAAATSNEATVRILAGPVPGAPPPGMSALACGSTYRFTLIRNNAGNWSVQSTSVAVC